MPASQIVDIAASAQQLDVRMPAYNPAAAARSIQQYPLKRLAVPPFTRVRRIRRQRPGGPPEPLQGLVNLAQTLRVPVQREQVNITANQLEQVARFAAWRGAGIQNPLPGYWRQQLAGQLRRPVLNRNPAAVKARQLGYSTRLGQANPVIHPCRQACCVAMVAQLLQVLAGTGPGPVYPEPHRRLQIAAGDDVFPVLRPVAAQNFQHPARMRTGRNRVPIQLCLEGISGTQIFTQHSVDQAGQTRPAEIPHGIDCFGHRGMVRRMHYR